MKITTAALRLQGAYYLLTGVAPFVSRKGFEAVTGRKRDWWLAQTVGAVVTAIGVTLIGAARRERVTPEITGLAAGSAAVLGAIDGFYTGRGRNSNAYLLDAVAQAIFVMGLAAGRFGPTARKRSGLLRGVLRRDR